MAHTNLSEGAPGLLSAPKWTSTRSRNLGLILSAAMPRYTTTLSGDCVGRASLCSLSLYSITNTGLSGPHFQSPLGTGSLRLHGAHPRSDSLPDAGFLILGASQSFA